MNLIQKTFLQLSDPLFFRRIWRRILRGFRSFDDKGSSRVLDRLPRLQRVLVVVAHPDDEVFCSGLLLELKERGCLITILCVTRGEGGPCGQHTREELGAVRSREMSRSCEVLGVDELIFLGHVDPVGGSVKSYPPDVSPGDLAGQIRPHLQGVDLLVSHGSSGEYWHPAHLLVFEAVRLVLEFSTQPGPAWMTFLARQMDHPLPRLVNWDDPAFLVIENPEHQEARLSALACHESQIGLFGQFAEGDYRDFIRMTSKEAYALQKKGRLEIPKAADESEGEGNHGPHGRGERSESKTERLAGR